MVTLKNLKNTLITFDQGKIISFYFAEEVLSTYSYKRLIRRMTEQHFLILLVGLNGYTLCSGIICEELKDEEYCAVKLKSDEIMTIRLYRKKRSNGKSFGKEIFGRNK